MDGGSSGAGLVGVGIYTLPQAARLAHVPAASLHRWLYGYHYKHKGERVDLPPVAVPDDLLKALRVVTFLDLIEIQFIHEFRKHGVSWKTLRFAAHKARELTGSKHPFASREFVSDGKKIFAEIAQASGNKELLDLESNQMAFRRILLPSLVAKLDLGKRGVERLWPAGKKRAVVVDPARQFGQPIIATAGVPTETLWQAYEASKSYESVANWYAIRRQDVKAAVDFERRMAA